MKVINSPGYIGNILILKASHSGSLFLPHSLMESLELWANFITKDEVIFNSLDLSHVKSVS